MEEKRREAGALLPSSADSPASEPASSRRRAGGQKRKANSLNASNSSSTPSKRITREKASPAHPPAHNGPLTRARQIPNNLAAAAAESASASGGGSAPPAAFVKQSKHSVSHEILSGNLVAPGEEFNKESKWEALEAAIEAEFEDIRSRGVNAHVVPSHCGWFSWTDIHPIEKHTLPSFFNGKTENRTPDTYIEIRNWIMKKFHANPNALIELKDLSELNVADLDARQEVMEFLDYWGLINFHPFPSMDSAMASADDDVVAEKNSLLEQLYRFETLQLRSPVVPKTTLLTPSMPPGLFPESTIAEELVKQEGPSVEYHCNSCSADCSRKRYHCQKQADFDLCTDCFSNGKFGSGMSSTDFILMEPAEVPGVSGGKWTDQETLLLLEALELYKENWNEIAEHVATKTKAQCILHFVQMPIEDAFVDCSDDIEASFKENADAPATNNDSSVLKNTSEMIESRTGDGDGGEGQMLSPQNEISKTEDVSKVKGNKESPKPEDHGGEKITEETFKQDDTGEVKISDADNACAIMALKEAFEAVGYSLGSEDPSSFAEVGNPVMALAVFLARLVGNDAAVASAHNSLKSISGNSPSIQLAARHCFVLEDPPDDKKETTSSERDSNKDGDPDDKNDKQDRSMLDDKGLSNDVNDKKTETNAVENKSPLDSTNDGASEKPISLKEQAMPANHEEAGLDNCNDPSNSKLPANQAACTTQDSDGSTSKAEIISSSVGLGEGASIKEPCQPAKELKDGNVVSDSLPSEKNEVRHSVASNPAGDHLESSQTPKESEVVSVSITSDESKHSKSQSTNPVDESLGITNSVMDVDSASNSLPSERNISHPLVTSDSSQPTRTEKDVDMMPSVPLDKNEPSHPVMSNSHAENGACTGEVPTEDGTKSKDDSMKKKQDNKFEKVKRAAVSTLAAATVKAKLLANQEEDQIRQLATLLIEKQLHKLEAKLAFFNEMENVVMRMREHLDRSRQKLYHERAMIIASRLGLPASSSRGVPSSLPTNRIATNLANLGPRLPITMNPQRPPMSRSMGTSATTLPNPLASATAAGNSVRPASQDKLSSVGTK
ncbi:hypothetical protein L6164_035575 [Bauhinia variegata]|uniref:Uncharacterized protein n=1 Tax=Bauhinia variegata TaxID=167791 RepID=A0ACB9KEE9_BAUVA|nr:hypothetical protein L6164_035575 [Bauhinia variegata]